MNPDASLEVVGSFRAGDCSNYFQISDQGDIALVGNSDYLVGANRYAFRVKGNYAGLKIALQGSYGSFEFLGVQGQPLFSIRGNGDCQFSKNLKVLGNTSVENFSTRAFQFKDGTEGAGKFLTSNANGDATRQALDSLKGVVSVEYHFPGTDIRGSEIDPNNLIYYWIVEK